MKFILKIFDNFISLIQGNISNCLKEFEILRKGEFKVKKIKTLIHAHNDYNLRVRE